MLWLVLYIICTDNIIMPFLFKFLIHLNIGNKYPDPAVAAIKIKHLVTIFSGKTKKILQFSLVFVIYSLSPH